MSYEQIREEYVEIVKAANNLIGLVSQQSTYGENAIIEHMMSLNIVELRNFMCESLGKLDVFMAPSDGKACRWETRDEFNERMFPDYDDNSQDGSKNA